MTTDHPECHMSDRERWTASNVAVDAQTAARVTAAFRHVNRFMVALWRLGLGRPVNGWPRGSGRILIIGHTGRRSGLRRWTPLNYAQIDGQLYCTSGFGAGADWYRNVLAEPSVEVWLPGRRRAGVVEDISDHPERLRLLREVLLASGFAAPAAGVDPRHLDDEALAAATSSYRLLTIHQAAASQPLPEHPRPGDRAWWWIMLALPGVIALGHRRRDRRGLSGCGRSTAR
jgi:deazaflavin-dependent oxidoreductase (nitroreductase family)